MLSLMPFAEKMPIGLAFTSKHNRQLFSTIFLMNFIFIWNVKCLNREFSASELVSIVFNSVDGSTVNGYINVIPLCAMLRYHFPPGGLMNDDITSRGEQQTMSSFNAGYFESALKLQPGCTSTPCNLNERQSVWYRKLHESDMLRRSIFLVQFTTDMA